MRDYTIRLGDSVEIDGEHWIWESVRRGTEAKLRRDGTADDWLCLSMPELLGYAGTARRPSTTPLRVRGGDWPSDVLDMERHLLEVFEGTPMNPNATGPRPEYDVALTTQESRIASKVGELAGTSLSRSRKTLFNYWSAYQAEGVAGVDARMHRKGTPRLQVAKADPRLIAVIDRELDRRTDQSTSSLQHCKILVRRMLESMYPGDDICCVKDKTLQGYINERAAGRYSFGKATSRRNTSNSPDRQYHSADAHTLGAVCEIDSTPLDVQVWDDRGHVFRPILTVLFCVASRVPLSWAIHANEPNGFDHAMLLARAIVGRRAIPGSGAATLSGSVTLPVELMKRVNPFLEDDSLAVPWIFPKSITVDGGRAFRGGTFEGACRAFGVEVVLAPPNGATTKPHVERVFGTMSTDFATWLAGSTGNSVPNRGAKDNPTLTIDSVRLAFDAWVTTVYLNRQHKGLRSPLFPGRKWTPNQMYAALFEVGPGVQLPFRADEYFALLPSKPRVISAEGIELKNRRYDSPLLGDLRGRSREGASAGSLRARKFDVHFDPYNSNAVWVQHPETGEWIECWDTAIDDRGSWMVTETEIRLAERFGPHAAGETPKTVEFVDLIEKRARADKRSRQRFLHDQNPSPNDDASKVSSAAPDMIDLQRWAPPVEVDDIDWLSPAYDIITVKDIGS